MPALGTKLRRVWCASGRFRVRDGWRARGLVKRLDIAVMRYGMVFGLVGYGEVGQWSV